MRGDGFNVGGRVAPHQAGPRTLSSVGSSVWSTYVVGNGCYGASLIEQTYEIMAANNVVMNNGNMGKGGGGIRVHDAGPYYQGNHVYGNNNNSNGPSRQ